MKKILITGGAGYVGSNLIRDALAKNYFVRCLDLLVYGGKSIVGLFNHPNFEFVYGDIRDEKTVRKALEGIDIVVHLAAIVGDLPCQCAPKSAYQINFLGTKNVADIAKACGVKHFIFSSTCSNYGVIDCSKPAGEDTPLNPVSLYAETKIDCEKYLLSISDDNFITTSLRFGTAFGISFRTRFDLLVNSFVYEAITQKKIVVFAANMWRPYIHVSDMGKIILTIIETPSKNVKNQIFNAGATCNNHTKEEVVEMIKKRLPYIDVHYANDIDDKRNYRIDFTKLEKATNFKPSKSVQNGINEIVGCFENDILTKNDFESNKLETLKTFFTSQESLLNQETSNV